VDHGASKAGDEHLAGLLLRTTLGVDVSQHDDGARDSMYDLDVTYPDGRRGVAEVVSTRDRGALAQLAAAVRLGYVRDPRLTKFWWVQISESASLKAHTASDRPAAP
jgi:hypothetical protein